MTIHYCDADGKLQSTLQRRFFSVIDGIIGGEDNGPLAPTAKPAGCLIAGEDLYAVDMVTTRMMGLETTVLKQFSGGTVEHDLAAVRIVSDGREIDGEEFFDPFDRDPMLNFRPHPGWVGHLEIGCSSSTKVLLQETN